MRTQKIHEGKGDGGLGESTHPISKDDATGEEFREGPATLRVEARLTEDENEQPFATDEIEVELVKGQETQQPLPPQEPSPTQGDTPPTQENQVTEITEGNVEEQLDKLLKTLGEVPGYD